MSPHASGESGFAVWLGAERKSTTRNAQRANAYVMLLRRRRPWQQLCTLRLIYFVVAAKYARRPLDYHAPAFGNAMVVGLEQHVIVDRSAHQLAALGGAEQHSPVLDDEVDREDVRPAIHACDEPSQRDARQKIPAFRLRQDGDRLRFFVHGHDVSHGRCPSIWSKVPQIEHERPRPKSAAPVQSAPSTERQIMTGIAEWCSRLSPMEPSTAPVRSPRPRLPMTKSCASCAKRKSAPLGVSESTTSVTYTPGNRSIHGINMSERCCRASHSTCPQSIMNGSATSPAGRRVIQA